ncbi:MAG: hypothetical protein E6356_17250 [Terrisporobacter othiniensis]|nr:hypothetical protein [Terrisporobacter othiniensis]
MSERKIDLSGLPRKRYGNKEIIDWKNSVGCKCKFTYDDIKGEIEIINYNSNTVNFKYGNIINKMKTSSFSRCYFGKILGKITNEFKVEKGSVFKDSDREITVTNMEYRKDKKGQKWKYYKYTCNKCGWTEGWIEESSLLKGRGCSCCAGKIIVPGINDLATTDPWMIKYLANKDDAYKYTSCSGQYIYPICPDCGRVRSKKIKISMIYNEQSVGCNCSDGVRYPNKFMFNILEQLNVKFETEYSPKWADGRRFDFYIPSKNLIIEMDGRIGHGNSDTKYSKKEESKLIDNWKDEKANKHNLQVIRIDCAYCRHDRFEFIMNNIISSKLNLVFDLSKINWNNADKYGINNKIKEVCAYYELHKKDMLLKDIASIFNINGSIMLKYLKNGNKYGWCKYDKKEVMDTRYKLKKPHNCKRILILELNKTFNSIVDTSNYLNEKYNDVNFDVSSISRSCKNKKPYKGFTFKYV